jgi:hypothetical protein
MGLIRRSAPQPNEKEQLTICKTNGKNGLPPSSAPKKMKPAGDAYEGLAKDLNEIE